MYVAFDGNTCCWHIYGNSITYMCSQYVGCSSIVQWDKCVQCGRHICSGAYANNVNYINTSVPGHIVYCSEFI